MSAASESALSVDLSVKVPGKREFLNEYLAGCAGGVTGLLVGHPFDTVKVILQTQGTATEFKSIRHCISVLSSYSFSKGFFRGLSAPLFTQAASNGIYFGTYFNCKYHILPRFIASQNLRESIAGCLAGCAMLSIAVPVDVVKIIMQSQVGREKAGQSRIYTSSFHCALDLIRVGGLRAAYRGLALQAVVWVPSSGLYFWLYETFKRFAVSQLELKTFSASLLAGGIAGTLSWLSVAPLDVLKSRMQADPTGARYRNVRECVRVTWSLGGYRAMFRGTSVLVARAFPVNAITFATYEYAICFLSQSRGA